MCSDNLLSLALSYRWFSHWVWLWNLTAIFTSVNFWSFFLAHLLIHVKSCPSMSTYSNANAKLKNWTFEVQFPGNYFEFDIIGNDFWSVKIWTIEIQVLYTEFEKPNNHGIQAIYMFEPIHGVNDLPLFVGLIKTNWRLPKPVRF